MTETCVLFRLHTLYKATRNILVVLDSLIMVVVFFGRCIWSSHRLALRTNHRARKLCWHNCRIWSLITHDAQLLSTRRWWGNSLLYLQIDLLWILINMGLSYSLYIIFFVSPCSGRGIKFCPCTSYWFYCFENRRFIFGSLV